VLQLPSGKSEDCIEHELIARARRLGIAPSPSSSHNASDKRYTSSAESASTVPTYHVRTFSTASNDSASTALTVQSSIFTPPSPEVAPAAANDKRPPPRNLNFSHYDKYLTQIDKNLDQPKFRNSILASSAATTDPSSKSLFSVSTRRSLASVKSNIKHKIRWRRKSIQPYVPNLFVLPRTPFAPEFHKLLTTHQLRITDPVSVAEMSTAITRTSRPTCTTCRAGTHTAPTA
jgi:hypothetical protein